MPNDIYNKITFDAQHSETVFSTCCPDGWFDFNTLIPAPLHVYRGSLSKEDREDFPHTWQSWNIENWGTKWNSYQSACRVENKTAIIVFYTAWSVPYPVIVAFANKFGIPFEHRYLDQMENFWGIENWVKYDELQIVARGKKQYNNPEHIDELIKEEKKYITRLLYARCNIN